jgi:hypothetical protein
MCKKIYGYWLGTKTGEDYVDCRPKPSPFGEGCGPIKLVLSAALLERKSVGEVVKKYFKFSPSYYK